MRGRVGALGLGRGVRVRKSSQDEVASAVSCRRVPGYSDGVGHSQAPPTHRLLFLFSGFMQIHATVLTYQVSGNIFPNPKEEETKKKS